MQITIFKRSILTGIAVLGLAAAVPVVAEALPARAEQAQTSTQTRQTIEQTNVGARTEAAQTRLTEARLKACQNREQAITKIMTRIGERGQKHIDLFDKIAVRTEKFYTEKGKTLSNYDSLVADVAAKKAAAQTAVDTVKSTSVDFKCDGSDPKGMASAFKDSLKAEIAALKEYRTSVKNLIVGVKSVQGKTSSSANGGTN